MLETINALTATYQFLRFGWSTMSYRVFKEKMRLQPPARHLEDISIATIAMHKVYIVWFCYEPNVNVFSASTTTGTVLEMKNSFNLIIIFRIILFGTNKLYAKFIRYSSHSTASNVANRIDNSLLSFMELRKNVFRKVRMQSYEREYLDTAYRKTELVIRLVQCWNTSDRWQRNESFWDYFNCWALMKRCNIKSKNSLIIAVICVAR